MPALPDSNAVCAALVSVVTAPGCTTLSVQNRLLNQLTACTELSELTAGLNLPPSDVTKSPPYDHRKLEKYHDMYPRVVVPGTSKPYVSALPLPSGSLVVKSLASFTRSSQLCGCGSPTLVRQSLRISRANDWAENGTPQYLPS